MSSFGKDMTSNGAKTEAAENGLRIVEPKPNELFLDIDTDEQYARFEEAYAHMKRVLKIKTFTLGRSRRKITGKHITVTLGFEVNATERIALQAILGSDPRRETYSFWRVQNNDPIPTLFFEKASM